MTTYMPSGHQAVCVGLVECTTCQALGHGTIGEGHYRQQQEQYWHQATCLVCRQATLRIRRVLKQLIRVPTIA